MNRQHLRSILSDLQQGTLSLEEAFERLRDLPYQDLGYARLDHHRELRSGLPEIILAKGKTPQQVAELAAKLAEKDSAGLITHAGADAFAMVQARIPQVQFAERSGLIWWGKRPRLEAPPVAVISAGTSDLPVAEEAALTTEWLGLEVVRIVDVGVAGVHRLLDTRERWQGAGVIIVVAGMEGALPSVVAGLVPCPVLAVPTSVGYGASFSGLAALLTMLNSCSPGIAVLNIDNGFGAAVLAHRILARERP